MRLTVLFCHGNGGNISYRIEKARSLHEAGFPVFLFDYRGYGMSGGIPSEKGLYLDAEGALEFLRDRYGVKNEEVLVYGESLGGSVGAYIAAKFPVAGLITEGTFTSVRAMGSEIYPFIPSFMFSSKFDTLSTISEVNCAKLFMHSRDDDIVPFRMAAELYEAAPGPKRLLELEGDHNSAFYVSEEKIKVAIEEFLADLGKGTGR
jgi:hypothetical protein